MAKELSHNQCILLAVHYASSANIKPLHSFTPTRSDVLTPELVLRILLTYLPESTEPKEYSGYVEEVTSRLYLDYDKHGIEVDISPVKDISEEQAQKQVKKLHLHEINPPQFPPHVPEDLLTRFLIHRAYRIDEETGLLNLIAQLIEPFLARNAYLRTWYISVVLPILRMTVEYYPGDEHVPQITLSDFAALNGPQGTDLLLVKAQQHNGSTPISSDGNTVIARDVKCLVGPWMYGHTERKRRKLRHERPAEENLESPTSDNDDVTKNFRKIDLNGITEDDKTGHDWEYLYKWMVKSSAGGLMHVVQHLIEDWDGPSDVDFGGFSQGGRDYMDEDPMRKLELQYAQAAFAACYAVERDCEATIKGAHGILARLAELLNFIPPPDLASSVDSLPRIERHATKLEDSDDIADLAPENLLKPEHPLTTPRLETYMLLQMIVYSAYQLMGLGHPISMVHVAKLHFYQTAEEQSALLQKVLRGLSQSGARKDDAQWTAEREKLLWLWSWGIDDKQHNQASEENMGAGVLGRVKRELFEEEMLKVFVETGCYRMATQLYLTEQPADIVRLLPIEVVERVVLGKAMEAYDGASNGNRNRGGMKKASDITNAFRSYFPTSSQFRQASALIAATHALSFYSLTLQHGVPFQPVSIRVSSDPVGMLDNVLEQNARAYTKLDDLIAIGQGFVEAGLPPTESEDGIKRVEDVSAEELRRRKKEAERRVTFMAVEAALREDDFETAYSYIVNRLTPSGAELVAPSQAESGASKSHARNHSTVSARTNKRKGGEDDISWRAAFLAGRYRPATSSTPTLRRLEQRTELLSLALLLAPTSQLTDILAAWRRCEEEMTSLQLSQQQAEEEFDDRADKRVSTSNLPGNFTISGEQPELVLGQKRREMGRFGNTTTPSTGSKAEAGAGDAPMSMFDLTRSAASAFSKNAFPLRSMAAGSRTSTDLDEGQRGMEGSVDSLASDGSGNGWQSRVRKRDMVANAVSGTFTSGLGWVLGAPPAQQEHDER